MQEQLEFPDKAVPRWFGHGLSLPPDSGIGLGSAERTGEKGAAHFKQISADDPTSGSTETTGWRWMRHWKGHHERGLCLDPVVQVGWSADNNLPEWAHSSGVGLTDTVARLQREVEDLRSESMYNQTGKTPIPPQRSRRTIFTSTKVPRFAGTTSWEQYRQVFEAIVISNGWDDATAAL